MEDKLSDMFSTPNIIKIINNANYKRHIHDILINKSENKDPRQAVAILDSSKLKRLSSKD